ncbi:MAG TPA: hypothetical protein PK668_25655 [Myxococcota bacterium]|nr:hypothetical protein [Myxococcota bacterium]HRY96914.1 hypothetical protein [Myxococcota bacterium]
MKHGDSGWTRAERKLLAGLRSPAAIQDFLDATTYSSDHFYRSPRRVLRERVAHCADGAMFAAAALRELGHRALIVDLVAERDDDHLLAVYRLRGCWGAVAKSNFVGLRYREPIHRSIRELALTYVEAYYNMDGEKSLRGYSLPFDLGRFDALGWTTREENLDELIGELDHVRHFPLLTPAQRRGLRPMDRRSFEGYMHGTRMEGVYFPPPRGRAKRSAR